MTGIRQAQNVCHACSSRKKACDKALPACSFCKKRQLSCRYDITALDRKGRREYNPGRHFVALQTGDADISDTLSYVNREQKLWPLSTLYSAGQSLEESIHQQVEHVIRLVNLPRNDIGQRYFQTFHLWLPVISPDLFYAAEEKYLKLGDHAPPADFSILLLAMCLIITLPTLGNTSNAHALDQKSLYTIVKSLFAQVQAATCKSLSLVQALLIIALCEHACARNEAAYISMATCTGFARVLGIDKSSIRSYKSDIPSRVIKLAEVERENVMWGIAMLERIVLSETSERGLRPLTEYPNSECRLPSNLQLSQPLRKQRLKTVTGTESALLSSLYNVDASQFGKQAQVVSFLDRILTITRFNTKFEHNALLKLAELAELDGEIRSFLKAIMDEGQSYNYQTDISTVVGLCIRSIFLLHRGILDTSAIAQTKADDQAARHSWAALDMVCQMVVDTVRYHEPGASAVMPFCCYYNLRDARQYLQERNSRFSDESLRCDIDWLLQCEETYCRKWGF